MTGTHLAALKRRSLWVVLILACPLLASCGTPGRYTSLDLALLPCELGEAPMFFRPIEFDVDGTLAYPEQQTRLINDLERGRFNDLVFFLHGWNKNPASAEFDYQNFICRFHGKLDESMKRIKREGGLRVIGIFWPSTITHRREEPFLLKPISYYKIKNRVDRLAVNGFAALLTEIGDVLIDLERSRESGVKRRLHLIGHSFGGRMMIRSFEKLSDDNRLVPILASLDTTNVALINAAAPPTFFDWIDEEVARAWKLDEEARFSVQTASFLFNIHTRRDAANRYLFRLASIFNNDPQSCAVGACGIPNYPTVCVDDAGKVARAETPVDAAPPSLNVRNVDATRIVFDHSDIYKGRIATLITDLFYDGETRNIVENAASEPSDCGV